MAKSAGLTIEYSSEPLPLNGVTGKILALDQALGCTGFAYYETGEILFHGHLKIPAKRFIERVDLFEDGINRLLNRFQPEFVLLETGGGFGLGKGSAEGTRGMIVAEYVASKVCHHTKTPYAKIHNQKMKFTVADPARLRQLKEQRLRNTLRPIKEDVQHRIFTLYGKGESEWYSMDEVDAIALQIAYATDPTVAELQDYCPPSRKRKK